MELDPRLHFVAVTAIIEKDGKFLITKRSPNEKAFPNKWTVPGGKFVLTEYQNLPKTSPNHPQWFIVVEFVLRKEVREEAGLEIEKPEYVTTQWFKDEGDAIILLGDAVEATPLLGLGGSAYLQVVHGKKNGSPPRCDLEVAKTLHTTLIGLIQSGLVKSAHDCSEGGLAVALAESCISQLIARDTPRLMGAQIDLSQIKDIRLDALLFGETQSRIVISCKALDAVKVVERAKLMGVPAVQIGKVGGDQLTLKTAGGEVSAPLTELHDAWWNSIARAMA